MIEFGKTLRTAREAKGYTVAQLAEMTHLAPSVVANLEKEDFSFLAAPIYGRGFVKLYCCAVGLEPKPLVDAFMESFGGNRPPVAPPPLPEAEPPKAEDVTKAAESEAVPLPEPPPPQQDLFAEPTTQEQAADKVPAFSRYSAPLRSMTSDISSVWRIGILAGGGVIVLALLLWGLLALRRATAPDTAAAPAAPATAETAKTAAEKPQPSAQKARAQQKIPALYLD